MGSWETQARIDRTSVKTLASFFNFFFNVYLYFERETEKRKGQRQRLSWGRAEREGDIESKAGSRL